MAVNQITVDFTAPASVLGDVALVGNFLRDCVRLLEMQQLGEARVQMVDGANPGVSGFQMITTSHIAVHTFTRQRIGLIDIFSCKAFNGYKALGLIESTFQAGQMRHQIVPRAEVTLVSS